MKNRRKLLLFDIDGTLLLTGGAGRIAIEQTFEEFFGISEAWGEIVPDGKTDPLIFQEIARRTLNRPLEDHEYTRLCERYQTCFRDAIESSPNYRVLPGVPNLLEALMQNPSLLLGVQTGNIEQVAWMKLRRGGIHHYFRFGGFGSDSAERSLVIAKAIERAHALSKTLIPSRDIFVIGDAPQDIRAGKALGTLTVAVATGRASQVELAACQPDYLLADFSDTDYFRSIVEQE